MKIIFCLKCFLPHQVAGTEIYVSALCQELTKLGVDVLVLKPGIGLKRSNEYFYEGIRVVEYPETAHVDKDLITGKRKPDGIKLFEEALLAERPDAIHFHEVSGSNGITIEHYKVAEKLRIAVFTTLHLIGYVCKTGQLKYKNQEQCDGIIKINKCSTCMLHNRGFRLGTAFILSKAGELLQQCGFDTTSFPSPLSGIFGSPAYIQHHQSVLHQIFTASKKVFILSNWFKEILLKNKLPEKKIVLVPQALPGTYGYSNEKESRSDVGDKIRFVYVGRICKIKGLHVVLEALKDVVDKTWSLDIYGKVTEDGYYNKYKDILGESGNIKWKGLLKPAEVVSTLSQYDALILPSIVEEMAPLTVQEAFAAKTPVIGSNVKGIADQVKHGINGLLFETGNPNDLRKVLEEVIKNKELLPHLTSNLKETVPFREIALKTLEEYQSVLITRAIVT